MVDTVRRWRALLPSASFADARNYLTQAGVSLATIFPDIVGLSRHLRMKYLSAVPNRTARDAPTLAADVFARGENHASRGTCSGGPTAVG